MPTEPQPGVAPRHMRIRYAAEPVTVTVGGHEFRVRARADERGVYDFEWLTGPPGYGFALSAGSDFMMTPAEMQDAAGDFLAGIDPATGYLRE